jgi:hypothetical protein
VDEDRAPGGDNPDTLYLCGSLGMTPVGLMLREAFRKSTNVVEHELGRERIASEDDLGHWRPGLVAMTAARLHELYDRIRGEVAWLERRGHWFHRWRYRRAIGKFVAAALETGEPADPVPVSAPAPPPPTPPTPPAPTAAEGSDAAAARAAAAAAAFERRPYAHSASASLRVLSLLRERLGGRCRALLIVGVPAKEALASVIAHMGVRVFQITPGHVPRLGPAPLCAHWVGREALAVPGFYAAALTSRGGEFREPRLFADSPTQLVRRPWSLVLPRSFYLGDPEAPAAAPAAAPDASGTMLAYGIPASAVPPPATAAAVAALITGQQAGDTSDAWRSSIAPLPSLQPSRAGRRNRARVPKSGAMSASLYGIRAARLESGEPYSGDTRTTVFPKIRR